MDLSNQFLVEEELVDFTVDTDKYLEMAFEREMLETDEVIHWFPVTEA